MTVPPVLPPLPGWVRAAVLTLMPAVVLVATVAVGDRTPWLVAVLLVLAATVVFALALAPLHGGGRRGAPGGGHVARTLAAAGASTLAPVPPTDARGIPSRGVLRGSPAEGDEDRHAADAYLAPPNRA
ncbi:hypothetical protein [Cellulomonas marina]|nr:hypothetical protein [Cellulomonas marina]